MVEDARDADEARARALRRNRFRLIALATLLVTVLVFTVISTRDYFTVGQVRLPDVVGMTYPEAARALRQAGVRPQAYVEDIAGARAQAVTTQTPGGGTVVREGRTIEVGVNNPPAQMRAPQLVGMVEDRALKRASELNVPVTSIVYQTDAKPAGVVIGQKPSANTLLGPDEQLDLTVSSGPPRKPVTVPDLTGMEYKAAVAELKKMGFTYVEALPGGLSFEKPGGVTSVRPKPGSKVPPGTPVAVFYALSGRKVVRVPDVSGMPLWRAQLALEAAQLQIGHVSYVEQKGKTQGVLKVEPSGFTLPGTPVLLTVNGRPGARPLSGGGAGARTPSGGALDGGSAGVPSPGAGNPGESRTVPFAFDPATMGMKRLMDHAYQLKLVVRDARGERTVLDRTLKAGQSVSTSVEVYGSSPLLQTYIDGVFFQAWRP